MKKPKRTVNRNLIQALIKYNGYTVESLGKTLDPPLSKVSVGRIIDPDRPDCKPSNRLSQIAERLHVPDPILFPFIDKE